MSLNKDLDAEEAKLLQSLYLMVLYLRGVDEHSPYLANPFPKRPKSRGWQSKETFTHLHCWIGLDFGVLDQLEAAGFLDQPGKGKRKKRTYIELNKRGMERAREILKELSLDGAQEALTARKEHEEYIHHTTRIDLFRDESE